MSKLCLVEVGKFLDILKSQHWFKWPKIANGPLFLPQFIIQDMHTTIWPKGKFFIIFIYLFEFFITINSFKLNKIWKNTKLMKSNLFVQKILSLDTQDSCIIICGMFWHDLVSNCMKKIGKTNAWTSNIEQSNLGFFWSDFWPKSLLHIQGTQP